MLRRSLLVALLALSAIACGRTDLNEPSDVPLDRVDASDVPISPDAPDVPPTGCTTDRDCTDPSLPHCRTDARQCVECVSDGQCPTGSTCLNFMCAAPCRPGGTCPGTEVCCGAFCTDTTGDPDNCGGCSVVCPPLTHASNACRSGTCSIGVCDTGFADCDGASANGCEVNVGSDPANCGACGRACGAGQSCSGGVCVGACGPAGCGAGLSCCGATCANTSSDVNNCGRCGQNCGTIANGSVGCTGGACIVATCDVSFGDCDRVEANGCETNLREDPANCGACGNRCGASQQCSGGTCVDVCGGGPGCAPGQQCCGMFCANVSSDVNNCGACGNRCPPVPNGNVVCASSTCAIGACSAGFADCNRAERDGCETNILGDPNNCGGCGVSCGPGGTCNNGVCNRLGCGSGPPCAAGQSCCGNSCIDIATDTNNCGGCGDRCPPGNVCVFGMCHPAAMTCPEVPCGAGQTCCGGTCLPTQSDPNNCGACFIRCGAGSACVGGRCQPMSGCNGGPLCAPGQACCATGCANVLFDPNNCGGCGTVCGPGATCQMGTCVVMGCNGGPLCGPAQTCCTSGCQNLNSDPNNCGACGAVCRSGPNATAACDARRCRLRCNPGFSDCNGNPNDGCETNTLTDTTNCGGCGRRCALGQSCQMGTCVSTGCNGGPTCAPGFSCCASGCTNTTGDANNCGACGRVCPTLPHASATCTTGVCGLGPCLPGFSNCDGIASNGCEADTQNDANNCGGCGVRCSAGLACMGAMCVPPSNGSEGAFNPTVNPTYLSAGVHNFTTITVPAGAVVYVAGSGMNSGLLDLRATGHVQIDGTIDVSGGPGTQSVVASMSTQQGRAGTGGYTGEIRSATPPAIACDFIAGVPGPNGPMIAGTTGTCTAASNSACTPRDNPLSFVFTSPVAQFGGGAGVFTGYRAYGSGGGGYAGGAPGALGATYMGEQDCTGASGGGGATNGQGGNASIATYNGAAGVLGQTQCDGVAPGVPRAWVGGGGGGSIGRAAAMDLAVSSTFYPGSGGGGGSADYLNRPAFGGTSGGGGGGGALRIWTTADIVVNGRLLANGGAGGDAYIGTPAGAMCDPQPGSAGGGGSGGVLYLEAPQITTGAGAMISAAGGRGGDASVFATGGSGGAGGLGRIRVSASTATCTLSGTFFPPLAAGCTPTVTPIPGRTYVGAYPN